MATVLIVEDDLVMADLLKDTVTGAGYEVCGIASSFSEAVALGLHFQPELAIIDMRLDGPGLGTDVAFELSAFSRIGVLYTTGDPSNVLANAVHGDACLTKPYRPDDLPRSLTIVHEIAASGDVLQPFPPGFRLVHPGTVPRRPVVGMTPSSSE